MNNRIGIFFVLLSITVSLEALGANIKRRVKQGEKYQQYDLRKKRDSIDDLHSEKVDPLEEKALGSAPIFRRKRDGDEADEDERQAHEEMAAYDSIKSAGLSIEAAAHDVEASAGAGGFKGLKTNREKSERRYDDVNNQGRTVYETIKTSVEEESEESEDNGDSNEQDNRNSDSSDCKDGTLNKLMVKSSALAQEITLVFDILRKREEDLMREMESLKNDVEKAIGILKSAEAEASKKKLKLRKV